MADPNLTPNQRLAVRAYWKQGEPVWGHVVQDYSSSSDSDYLRKEGLLDEDNFLFKPDGGGHDRLVDCSNIIR